MCQCVEDIANTLTIIRDNTTDDLPEGSYASAMKGAEGWKEIKVSTLDPKKFRYDESLQTPVPEAIEQIASQPSYIGVL